MHAPDVRRQHEFLGALGLAATLGLAGAWNPVLGTWLASEQGPVESGAVALWMLSACWLLWCGRPTRMGPWALAVVCVGLAVREHGLPPSMIPSGKALVQFGHYLDPGLSIERRVGEGAVVLGFLAAVVLTLRHLWRELVLMAGWRLEWGQRLLVGVGLLTVAQGIEGVAGEGGVLVEELLEVLGAWAVWLSVRAGLPRAPAQPIAVGVSPPKGSH